jgi:hypothetical protein
MEIYLLLIFFAKSGIKVWWKCDKGDDHEWKTAIGNSCTQAKTSRIF